MKQNSVIFVVVRAKVLQQRQQKKRKGQHSELTFKFRAACSAAGPELGGYTQWVRWRAPTEDCKKQKQEKKEEKGRCQTPRHLAGCARPARLRSACRLAGQARLAGPSLST